MAEDPVTSVPIAILVESVGIDVPLIAIPVHVDHKVSCKAFFLFHLLSKTLSSLSKMYIFPYHNTPKRPTNKFCF